MRRFAFFLLLPACQVDPSPVFTAPFIAPLDGQSGIDGRAKLYLHFGQLDYPDDYPFPDAIQVTNIQTGGQVPGTVERQGNLVVFTPDERWESNSGYAWRVPELEENFHGPSVELPPLLEEEARFYTAEDVYPLGFGWDEDDPCVVLSRQLDATDFSALNLSRNTEEVTADLLDLRRESNWTVYGGQQDFDFGVDVLCMPGLELAPGDELRMWLNDGSPFLFQVDETPVRDLLAQLRRSN